MSKSYISPVGYLSYPHLFTPQEVERPNGYYTGWAFSIVYPAGANLTVFQEAFNACVEENLKDETQQIRAPWLPTDVSSLGQCTEVKFKRTKTDWGPPELLGMSKEPLTDQSKWSAGVQVRTVFDPYSFKSKDGPGVSFGFKVVQWCGDDGTRLGRDDAALLDELPPMDPTPAPSQPAAGANIPDINGLL